MTPQLGRILRTVSSRPGFIASCALSSSSTSEASPKRLLRIGDVLTESRRFSECDVAGYAAISGDRNPIHLDAEFARAAAGFAGGRIVHGMLVASLFPFIIASRFPGAVYVSQTLNFKLPVYIGDAVLARVEATFVRQLKQKHMVKFSTKCFLNEEEETSSLLLDGEATAILPTLVVADTNNY